MSNKKPRTVSDIKADLIAVSSRAANLIIQVNSARIGTANYERLDRLFLAARAKRDALEAELAAAARSAQ